jgi:hypothetical protein
LLAVLVAEPYPQTITGSVHAHDLTERLIAEGT